MHTFEGKIAIVTGGGSGMGKAVSEELARRGAAVMVADLNKDRADRTAEAIRQGGGQAWPAVVDVSNEQEVQQLIDRTLFEHGRLDYMFNNAGIAIGGDARDLAMEQWHKVFSVNYYGVLYGSLHAYRVMAKQGFGHIINTASATGLMPQPGNAPYCASKHAVVGLSLSLRYEGRDLGVKVSTVCPGHVQTDIYKNMKVANVANEQVVASLPMKALNAQAAADIILDGVIRDKDVIIFPSNVKWAWRLHRWFPRLLDKAWLEKIRSPRRLRRESEGAAKG